WIGGSIWRGAPSTSCLLDADSTRRWSLILGCGLAIIAPLAANRLAPLRLHLHVPLLLLASAGAIAAAQMTILTPRVLIQEQLEKRKNAGFTSMNRKLYKFMQGKPLDGKIGTDVWTLDRLPGLKQYHRHFDIPRPATPEFLEAVLADAEVRYLLAAEYVFPPPLLVWLLQLGFRSLLQEQGLGFCELPTNRPGAKHKVGG